MLAIILFLNRKLILSFLLFITCHIDLVNYIFFFFLSLFRRTTGDILELVEQSLDYNLVGSHVRYRFQDTPLLGGTSVHEHQGKVIILVTTVASVHRLVFPHPNKIHRPVSIQFFFSCLWQMFDVFWQPFACSDVNSSSLFLHTSWLYSNLSTPPIFSLPSIKEWLIILFFFSLRIGHRNSCLYLQE